MKQFFVLGLAALLALAGSGCATRGYARRQAARVNDRVTQVQTQLTALSAKHDTDVSHVNERFAMADNKLQEAASSAAQANANAAQANANAARADASAAQANATAARPKPLSRELTPLPRGLDPTAARADVAAAQERAAMAENHTARVSAQPVTTPTSLPRTGSPLPLSL